MTAIATGAQRLEFAQLLLERLGAPATASNLAVLVAWMQREGTSASFNPLATALRAPGSTNFNNLGGGMGVQNYPTLAAGVDATARTLEQANFAAIYADLRDGRGDAAALEHDELRSWSGGGYDHLDLGTAPATPSTDEEDPFVGITADDLETRFYAALDKAGIAGADQRLEALHNDLVAIGQRLDTIEQQLKSNAGR